MKKSELYGYVCYFSVNYDSIDVNNILDNHCSKHPRQSVVAKIVFRTSIRNFFIQIALFKETILLVMYLKYI